MNGFLARLQPSSSLPWIPEMTWKGDGIELVLGGPARFVERGPWVAAVEARLAHPDTLCATLDVERSPDRRATDAVCLVAAFERWGADAVRHLEGAFAALLWHRETGTGWAVRDRLGLRTLFRTTYDELVIGSSLAAVCEVFSPGMNESRVAAFLAGRWATPRDTFGHGIERVPAATLLSFSAEGRTHEQTYWSLDAGAPFGGRDADAEEGFLDQFDRSVAASLGGELGAFLSGGLDSSSIVVTARQLEPERPLPAFSILYDRPEANETRHLEAVADAAGVDVHRVDGERLSLLDGLDADLAAVGEPFAMPNLFLTRTLYAEAQAAGLEAVLDGFAGDNVVGHGERRLVELARSLRWLTLAREVQAIAHTTRQPRRAGLQVLRDYVLAPLIEPIRSPSPAVTFAHPDLLPPPPLPETGGWTDHAAHVADLSSPLLQHAFEVAYAVGTAHGIEPRFPFASVPLVEFCLSLPSHQRMRDGLTRSILRRAMQGRLPESVRLRPGKARLATNFAEALFVRDAECLRQLVAEDAPLVSDVLDVAALTQAVERALAQPEARARLALPIWRAVMVARWRART